MHWTLPNNHFQFSLAFNHRLYFVFYNDFVAENPFSMPMFEGKRHYCLFGKCFDVIFSFLVFALLSLFFFFFFFTFVIRWEKKNNNKKIKNWSKYMHSKACLYEPIFISCSCLCVCLFVCLYISIYLTIYLFLSSNSSLCV